MSDLPLSQMKSIFSYRFRGCVDSRLLLFGLLIAGIGCFVSEATAQDPLRFLASDRIDGGGIVLNLETSVGTQYRIESSLDLIEWEIVTEIVATESVTPFSIADSAERTRNFYRATTVIDPLQSALDENRAKWSATGWMDYKLRIDVSEFIPQEVSQGIVTVEAGQVVDVDLPLSNGTTFGFRFNYPLSIQGLFDRLQGALNQNPASARITYHPDFGYPTEAFIDFDERIADEESGFRVALLGPTRVEPAPTFELPDHPFAIRSAEIVGNTLNVDLEYGGGCRGHLFALLDLMPGVFAESLPPRPVIALRHNSYDDLCKAIVRETRVFDLSHLAVSATKAYGSPIPMIIDLGSSTNTGANPVSVLYSPAGSREFLPQRATSQAWVGGVQGSGSGIDYRFKMTLLADGAPNISDVWIGQRQFEPTIHVSSGKKIDSLVIGDVIEILCHFRRVPVFEGLPFESEIVDWRDEPAITTDGPSYDGVALIRYEGIEASTELVLPIIAALPELLFP